MFHADSLYKNCCMSQCIILESYSREEFSCNLKPSAFQNLLCSTWPSMLRFKQLAPTQLLQSSSYPFSLHIQSTSIHKL